MRALHYLESVGVPVVSKKGQAPMHIFEVSASGVLANAPLMKARHKTAQDQEMDQKTASPDMKGGKVTLRKAIHTRKYEQI